MLVHDMVKYRYRRPVDRCRAVGCRPSSASADLVIGDLMVHRILFLNRLIGQVQCVVVVVIYRSDR